MQELEKFKFVLNYKIAELRRQIAPRKREMGDLREHTKEMELELLQYHKSNASLDLMIADLRLRRDGMRQEVRRISASLDGALGEQTTIARDVAAVQSVAGVSPAALRAAMVRIHSKYVHGEAGASLMAVASSSSAEAPAAGTDTTTTTGAVPRLPVGVDVADVQREMARQRDYLERGVASAQRKIAKGLAAATADDAKLARDNASLASEVAVLTRDLALMRDSVARATVAAATAATQGRA